MSLVDWGVAVRLLAGQSVSGDHYLVQPLPRGTVLAVVDGLGHGREAAEAARIAVNLLQRYAREPIVPLLQRCHEGLRGTRGVVMSIGVFTATNSTLTWAGIGNVEGILFRSESNHGGTEHLLPRPGVLGDQFHGPAAAVIPVCSGDTLVFATDGIRKDFTETVHLRNTPSKIAEYILNTYGRDADDAMVLVARYLGD